MIALGSPTEILRARLAAAAATVNPSFSFTWGDDGATVGLGNTKGAFSGTSNVTLAQAPSGLGIVRVVRSGFIYNADSADVAITIEQFDGTNARPLANITLKSGYTLTLGDEGFRVTDATGAEAAPVAPSSGEITFTATAKATVIGGSVVAVDPVNGVYNPDLSIPADVNAIAGIAKTSANTGNPVTVMTEGQLTEGAWGWSQGPLYCASTGGGLTQTAPATGAVVPVGVALSPNQIQVGIQPPIFL